MLMTNTERMVVRAFQQLYYDGLASQSRIYENTTWMGVPCLKCPLDLWVYQELLFDIKPDLIIETGTYMGGSALYFAHLCDIMNHGRVVTIASRSSGVRTEARNLLAAREVARARIQSHWLWRVGDGLRRSVRKRRDG